MKMAHNPLKYEQSCKELNSRSVKTKTDGLICITRTNAEVLNIKKTDRNKKTDQKKS